MRWTAKGAMGRFAPGIYLLGALALAAAEERPASPPATGVRQSPATGEMAALLKERASRVDPRALSFVVNDRRADLFSRDLARPLPLAQRLGLRGLAAQELINAGRIEDALMALQALESDARASDPAGWGRFETGERMLQALAYLRLGEERNCHIGRNRDSCLAPIRGGGVHSDREGSARAAIVLEGILGRDPDNLRARWLLNVAHMTLGSYPSGVPDPLRIPPSAFASEYPLPRFDNVAHEVGLDLFGLSGGAVLDDFDNDGRLDLVVSSIGFDDQMRFFRNKGDGTFEDRTSEAGLTGEVGGLNMVQADYNNDGFVDVVVLRGGWFGSEGAFPLSLLRNNGDGTFTDVTREAGLLRFAPTQTAAWLDYDGDGWLDLFVGNESAPGSPYPCELFHNNRDGTFSERAHEAGVDFALFVKGVVSGDYDNDGRPDLYVSVLDGNNLLLRNEGPTAGGAGWHFKNVASVAGVTEPQASFPAFFFDYDNDGWLDLFVAGYGRRGRPGWTAVEDVAANYLGLAHEGETGRLYHNERDGTFRDMTRAAHLDKVVPAMGLNFGDLDNDGWLDFYVGTGTPDLGMLVPNRMFRNDGRGVFQDVTTSGNFGHLQKGHAISFGDVDNDGGQDVFEQMGGAYFADKAYSALYLNPGSKSAWLGLELEGVRSNRRGVGARIKVAVDSPSGPRFIHRTVGSGGSFGASPLRSEIGLGDARRVEWIEVFWPSTGQTQRILGLRPRHRYRIREGSEQAREVEWPRIHVSVAAGR